MTFILADFADPSWCARIRASMDAAPRATARIAVDGYRVDEDVRRVVEAEVDESVIADVEDIFARVRPILSRFFATSLTRNEGPGFLRYEAGGFYRSHSDCLGGDAAAEFPRRISLVLFLTTAGPGDGGALRLHDAPEARQSGKPFDIAPVVGTLVAFPSTWLHEVRPVTNGIRDAIVDWLS